MTTPFLSDYLKVVEATADIPADPVTDPGTSEEMIAFCFDAEAGELSFWDPVSETRLVVSLGGASLTDTDDLAEGATNQYFTDERVDDRVAALIQNGTGITWSYNDGAGTLTPTVTVTQYTDELVDDRVAVLIQNGTGITWSYNDAGGTLTPTVTITQYTDELAQDAVGGILTDNNFIDFTYNDGTPSITADVKFFGAKVKKSVNQTTANYTSDTTLTWDAEIFDVGGFHDNVTNNTRLTVPAGGDGYYQVLGQIVTDLDTADRWHNLYLIKNGTLIGDNTCNEGGFSLYSAQVQSVVYLAAGDYVELVYKTESDASITVTTDAFLAAYRLGS